MDDQLIYTSNEVNKITLGILLIDGRVWRYVQPIQDITKVSKKILGRIFKTLGTSMMSPPSLAVRKRMVCTYLTTVSASKLLLSPSRVVSALNFNLFNIKSGNENPFAQR